MAVARVGCTPGAYHVLAGSAMKKVPTFAHPRLAVAESAVRAFGALVVGLPFRTEHSRKRTRGHRLSQFKHVAHGVPVEMSLQQSTAELLQ